MRQILDGSTEAVASSDLLVFPRDSAFIAMLTLKNASKHLLFLWRGAEAVTRVKVLLGLKSTELCQKVVPTLGAGTGAVTRIEQVEDTESALFFRALHHVSARRVVVCDTAPQSSPTLPSRVFAVHADVYGQVCGREVSREGDANRCRLMHQSKSYAILTPSSSAEEAGQQQSDGGTTGGFGERCVWHGAQSSTAQRELACEIASHCNLRETTGRPESPSKSGGGAAADGAAVARDISGETAAGEVMQRLGIAPSLAAVLGTPSDVEATPRYRLFKVDHKRFKVSNPLFVSEEEAPFAQPMLDSSFCFLLETGESSVIDQLIVWRGADATDDAQALALAVAARCVFRFLCFFFFLLLQSKPTLFHVVTFHCTYD